MIRLVPLLALSVFASNPFAALSQNSTTTLEALRDHHRVLVVFANGDNQLAATQLRVASEHADGFRERDLVLLGLTGTDSAVPTATLSADADRAARIRFHIKAGEFTVVLLGKDGGEKLRSRTPVPWETLQSTIDAMPMRKGEIRSR